jgi:hypothetical protein
MPEFRFCSETKSAHRKAMISSKPFAIAYIVCCAAAGLSAVYHLIRMMWSLRPEPPGRPHQYYNRANALFYPADLTPQGQRHRDRAIFSILVFLALLWLSIVLAAMA